MRTRGSYTPIHMIYVIIICHCSNPMSDGQVEMSFDNKLVNYLCLPTAKIDTADVYLRGDHRIAVIDRKSRFNRHYIIRYKNR